MPTPRPLLALLPMLLALLALLALTACASSKYAASAPARSYEPEMDRQFQMERRSEEMAESAPATMDAPSAGVDYAEQVVLAAGITADGGEMYRAPSGGGDGGPAPAAAPAPPPPPPPPPPGAQPRGPSQAAGPSTDPGPGAEVAVPRKPMLIYIAGMWLVVDDVTAALSQVEAMARELGGYLGRRDDASITIRVPSARFDEALARVEKLGDVRRRDVSVEDVTEEFLDLEIRLKNLRAVRARLEKLLEKAKTVEEAVLLERELARVAGEIDRIEGRMKFLQDRATFSTITVHAQPRPREVIGAATPRLPVPWLGELGLGRLLSL